MPCYHPVSAFKCADGSVVFSERARYDVVGDFKLPCRQCIGCRLDRAHAWTVRCVHEAQLHEENCFLTLTYSDENLPPGGCLRHRDFQLFMKRLRRHTGRDVRYYMCGEYGTTTFRPHYHACLFGFTFSDQVLWRRTESDSFIYSSRLLDRLWGLGNTSVGAFTRQTAAYVSRYVLKKVTGDLAPEHYRFVDSDGVVYDRPPEYNCMSTRPAIGRRWFDQYHRDVFPGDYVVADGLKTPVPPYYSKRLEVINPDLADEIKQERQLNSIAHSDNRTPDRLAVREEVHQAKVRNLKRESI